MRVTVDLAKKHLKYNDYSIEVYKADVVKLLLYIEELEKKLTLNDVVKQRELLKDEDIPNIDNWIKDLGYTQITFSYVYKNGGTYKDREQLCKEYKKEFCL